MNENNTLNAGAELEQMRNELNSFKSILKQQRIVNSNIMRRAMQSDWTKERRTPILVTVLALLSLPALIFTTCCSGIFPLWFLALTIALELASIACSAYWVRRYVSGDTMNGNVTAVAENLAAYRRMCNKWTVCVAIPVLMVWLAMAFWFMAESAGEHARGMIVGGIVGLAVGSALGILHCRDSKRRINRMLGQIEEIKAMEQ